MVYECDNCEVALGPGLTVCPRCGQVFDEPVPADALWDEPVSVAVTEGVSAPPPLMEAAPPKVVVRASRRWPRTIAATLLLLELGWLGYHLWSEPTSPEPAFVSASRLPTDLATHPEYTAHMTAFVQHLRATGVGAEWPAFGSNDVLLITPQARAAEPPVAWDADMDHRLAQGIYGNFVLTRHESGYLDTDAMACFVLVTSASGEVVAVDFMGELK